MNQCPYCCDKCPEGKRPVPGQGPRDAAVVCVGEGPGQEENNRGIPFCGKAGAELDNTYMPLGGLYRSRVYVTNTVKCHVADSGKAPGKELIAHCSGNLLRAELERIKPKIVVLMGATACSLVPGIDLDLDHGISRRGKIFDWEGIIYPTYHPALGLHQPSAMRDLLSDFNGLRKVLRGESTWPVRPVPVHEYDKLTKEAHVNEKLARAIRYGIVAVDTESEWTPNGYNPWSIQFCTKPGYSYLVRKSDPAAWYSAWDLVSRFPRIILHNGPADMRAAIKAGRPLSWNRIHDSMERAYRLGLPQGLKVLGFRLLGIRMKTFQELAGPYSRDKALEYLIEAAVTDWGKPEAVGLGEWIDRKCKTCGGKGKRPVRKGSRLKVKCSECRGSGTITVEKVYQAQGINQKLERLIRDGFKDSDVDVWDRWDNWEEQTGAVEKFLGPIPRQSIALVPEAEAIPYGCQDADVTLQVFEIEKRMGVELRRRVR